MTSEEQEIVARRTPEVQRILDQDHQRQEAHANPQLGVSGRKPRSDKGTTRPKEQPARDADTMFEEIDHLLVLQCHATNADRALKEACLAFKEKWRALDALKGGR
jgi:hypothetical protein